MLLLPLVACSRDVPLLTGSTMGTTYSVIVPNLKRADQTTLQAGVEAALAQVNNAMSTYQDDSSISRFNASDSTGWFDVPQSFSTVLDAALGIAKATDGAFDPSIGPLVKRWGFGKQQSDLPSADEVSLLLEQTGFNSLAVDTVNARIRKSDSRLQIDLNAIAKGYAVDQLAAQVESLGHSDYLVEIGGELRVRGSNAGGDRWRIGIESPVVGDATADAPSGLYLSAGGVATSGDYRNAFEQDGTRYSHIIDARSGVPVGHNLASVTVVAESAMLADGWATALMVLGPNSGMQVAEKLGLASHFIVRDPELGYQGFSSSAFTALQNH